MFNMQAACRLLLGVFLLLLTPAAWAQYVEDDIEQILRWFPQGNYDLVAHHDWDAIQHAETYPLYEMFFRPFDNPVERVLLLPGVLRNDRLSRTVARLTRVETRSYGSIDDFIAAEGAVPRDGTFRQVGSQVYSVASSGELLLVIRYPYLSARLRQGELEGSLFRTGLRILNQPVYTFRAELRGEIRIWYAWPGPFQELLIAPSTELLEEMVAAGVGQGLRLLDGLEYEDLRALNLELGQSWRLVTRYPHMRRLVQVMRSIGDNPNAVASLEQQLEREPKFSISARSLSERLSFYTINHFASMDFAQQWMDQKALRQDVGIMSPEFLSQNLLLLYRPQIFERSGGTVIGTLRYEYASVETLWDEYEMILEEEAELGLALP